MEVTTYCASYTGDDSQIHFSWNGKHSRDFEDANQEFRRLVLQEIFRVEGKVPVTLLRDVFIAETKWAREAWCVHSQLEILAAYLLEYGKSETVDAFLKGRGRCFDSLCLCDIVKISPALAAELRDYLKDQLKQRKKKSSKSRKTRRWKDGVNFFHRRSKPNDLFIPRGIRI